MQPQPSSRMTLKRSRLVVFRVTPDEYDSLKRASSLQGARSISDFARAELLRPSREPMGEIRETLRELQGVLHSICELLRHR